MRPHSDHDILGRTVRSSDPLVVELQFAMKDDAERVIAAFHGQKGDGQVLDVRFEDEDL
jgi:predicted regulator of Ras-like GTPase activity (Roadblock/LC7/MglB family)